MIYTSTRNNLEIESKLAILKGISDDGGLFVPVNLDKINFDYKKTLNMSNLDISKYVLKTFLSDMENLDSITTESYKNKFETDEITNVVKLNDFHILELFKGPTSAFKDVALSVLPFLIKEAKKELGINKETIILTATSGDTGKAAMEGFKNVEEIKIIVFYPHNGVSEMQERQMRCQEGDNVYVCAVKGNFDDCQREVKKAFLELNEKLANTNYTLSSANSINIGRLIPQIAYYFSSYKELVKDKTISAGDEVDFVVPCGNFGDILAGFYAKMIGLPVGKLVCATNKNKVLDDFIKSGVYDINRPFYKTTSPSMDILISSNLERLLYTASNSNTEKVRMWMQDLKTKKSFKIDDDTLSFIQNSFESDSCDEENVKETIKECWSENHYLLDPHSAVATYCAKRRKKLNPTIILSTASPYKFPDVILESISKKTSANCFEKLRDLNRITNINIPKNLIGLENRDFIFNDVVEKDDIVNCVMRRIAKE